jgi:hypothetical protein
VKQKQVNRIANSLLNVFLTMHHKTIDQVTDQDCELMGETLSDLCEESDVS